MAAARILGEHGATAATDVTGFGLAGHLLEMARASGVEVSVGLAGVPFLDGALELAGSALLLAPGAEPARARFGARAPGMLGDPATQLLFDPQTAGGLLAQRPRRPGRGMRGGPARRRLPAGGGDRHGAAASAASGEPGGAAPPRGPRPVSHRPTPARALIGPAPETRRPLHTRNRSARIPVRPRSPPRAPADRPGRPRSPPRALADRPADRPRRDRDPPPIPSPPSPPK